MYKANARSAIILLQKCGLHDPRLSVKRLTNIINRNPGFQLAIVDRRGSVRACAIGSYDGGFYGYVYIVAIHPKHRNQGYAKALLIKLLGVFREAGATHVTAHVNVMNIAGAALAKSCGLEFYRGLGTYCRTLS
jgi:ribosomal protein S18 acetylase RimI-like enzyme